MLKRARAAFLSGRTANACFRLAQLDAVMRLVLEHECEFVDALGRDLHKVGSTVDIAETASAVQLNVSNNILIIAFDCVCVLSAAL